MPDLKSHRQTRILATLGPATEEEETIGALLDAGASLFRLNMSHAKPDWARTVVQRIRSAAAARQRVVGISMDLQGPSIRTGDVPESIMLRAGEKFNFTTDPTQAGPRCVTVNYPNFVNDLVEGAIIQVDNGLIRLHVLRAEGVLAECEVEVGGELGSRRHINLPGTTVQLPALTEKDHAAVDLALELEVDYVALSFVREVADIEALRVLLAAAPHPPRVIAKIEDQRAVQNLDALIAAADAVKVARGDLGVECPYEDLPILQRRIVRACQLAGKPVIVATHMLESMIGEPMPTRAEVTDVANAVFEQADAVMLSGETSVGKFPVRTVEAMDRIARRMEREPGAAFYREALPADPRQSIARAAVRLAEDVSAAAIVVFTREGRLVPEVAWRRPGAPILALCPDEPVARSLSLRRAVIPVVLDWDDHSEDHAVDQSLHELVQRGHLQAGDTVVILSSLRAIESIAESVQLRTVGD